MKNFQNLILFLTFLACYLNLALFIKIGDKVNVQTFGSNYEVEVDKYSMLQSTCNFIFLTHQFKKETSGSVQVEIDGITSESISGSVPILSAVVYIDSGTIQSIEWDNGCWGCETTCVNDQGCPCDGSGEECNMRVYLSWIGSDSKKNRMTSGALRFSQFQKYSITSFYKNAQDEYIDLTS